MFFINKKRWEDKKNRQKVTCIRYKTYIRYIKQTLKTFYVYALDTVPEQYQKRYNA